VAHSINILFTSVGRRVELIRFFRRAYKDLDLEGRIVATDVDPLAPALHVVDRPYLVPRINESDYVPTLVKICRKENIDLIFPLVDPEIPILAHHRKTIETTNAKVVVVSNEAAETAGDKWLTYQFFRRQKIATPRSWLPDDLPCSEFPLFIKPRFGSAAKHTFRVNNVDELKFFLRFVPEPIVQEYLPGPEITIDVVCDFDGDTLAIVQRQRIEVRWGEVAKGVTVYDERITDACLRIAAALPAKGPITAQCIMKDDIPCFTEINPRFGGGIPLGIKAGVNAPLLLLAKAASQSIDIPSLGSYKTGLYLTRFDDSFFLDEVDREKMESHRL